MEVAVWLRSLGLSRYEAAFSDNSIDADILPDLTDGDLAQLGVNLGDRKRLLKAIASLGAIKPAAQPTTSTGPSSSGDAAERRPITVMFCDLVGSTSLAAKLDAEDWRNLVGSYLDEASAAVTGLGGHVLKKLGDGLMALFGYPQAQENDAERAVRAALAIQRALAELNATNAGTRAPQLIARIGLESGPVVVDATGEVFGDAPNGRARAGRGRTGRHPHHSGRATADRRVVRRRGSRRARAQRRIGAGDALSHRSRERRRPARRRAGAHAARRTRGGASRPIHLKHGV